MHPHLDQESDPQTVADVAEPEAEPDAVAAEAEPDAVAAEAEPGGEPEPEPDAEPEAEPGAEPEAEPALVEPESDLVAEPEPDAVAAEAEPGAEPEAEPGAEPEAEPGAEPEPEPALVEPESDLVAEPEPDAVAAEAEPGAGPEAEAAPGQAETPEPARAPEARTPTAAPATVAELIAATLRGAGVRIAFTVPGESFLPVLDALEAAGIRIVATRHEGAAAFAAEAYGQLTGRPAACLGTRIVGGANMAIGIHTATADSTPMFALVGQVERRHRGREAFQEADLVHTVGSLAKWAGEIDDPETAAAMLEEAAIAVLDGRPGPALLSLPEDVLPLPIPEGTRVPIVRVHPEAPSAPDIQAVLHFLAAAERPVILAGAGVLRARCSNDLVRFAELLHVPVIASWRRGDVIPNDHPLYLGMAGFGSPAPVRARLESADAILVLGSRLSAPTTFEYAVPARGQPWMHVDLEPRAEAAGTTDAPVRAIRADARAFLRAAAARLKDAVLAAEPLAARDGHNAADRAAWEASTVVDATPWSGAGVHPGRIIADIQRLLPEDGILTTDAGAFASWAARGFRFRRPGMFLGPTSGAMGYAFPAALAAALVHRERRVVALVGDGGMGMSMAEVETAVREDAHIVAVVFDDERYGMIRGHQDLEGSPTAPGTDLGPVDFAAAARACGARGVRVETDAAFEPAFRTALAASGSTVIQLMLDRRWGSVDRPATDESG